MAVTVTVPSVLLPRTQTSSLRVNARSLREAIEAIDREHPGFRSDVLVASDEVRPSLSILVDGERIDDLDRTLPDNVTIEIVRAMTGG